jgi:hypothetical protein
MATTASFVPVTSAACACDAVRGTLSSAQTGAQADASATAHQALRLLHVQQRLDRLGEAPLREDNAAQTQALAVLGLRRSLVRARARTHARSGRAAARGARACDATCSCACTSASSAT